MIERDYDALTHLVQAMFLTGDDFMVMLSAYFDESYSQGKNRVYTVAGYISTVEKWTILSNEWQALLGRDNLPSFSMKSFCNPHDQSYGKWSESKKKLFLRILHKLIKQCYLRSFSSSIVLDAYDALKEEDKIALGLPHAFTAIHCLKNIKVFAEKEGLNPEKMAYVFEKGSKHDRQLQMLISEFMSGENNHLYLPGSVVFEPKQLPALQAADVLAYETRKEMSRRVSKHARQPRLSLRNLADPSRDEWFYFDGPQLADLVSMSEFKEHANREDVKEMAVISKERGLFKTD